MEEPQNTSQQKNIGLWGSVWYFVWDFLKVFLIALIIIIPVRFYLFQPFIVTGQSMQPNFQDGEYLIIDEISYRFHTPNRGDVVVIRSPQDASQFFIKRVIGVPGDTVSIANGHVTISNSSSTQGTVLQEQYLPADVATFGNMEVSLGDTQYFVLGDNRGSSSDSRSFGPISRESVIGRVFLRAFPFGRLRVFSTPQYTY